MMNIIYIFHSWILIDFVIQSDANHCTYERNGNDRQWETPCLSVTTRNTEHGIEVIKTCRGDESCKVIEGCQNVTYSLFESLGMTTPTDFSQNGAATVTDEPVPQTSVSSIDVDALGMT